MKSFELNFDKLTQRIPNLGCFKDNVLSVMKFSCNADKGDIYKRSLHHGAHFVEFLKDEHGNKDLRYWYVITMDGRESKEICISQTKIDYWRETLFPNIVFYRKDIGQFYTCDGNTFKDMCRAPVKSVNRKQWIPRFNRKNKTFEHKEYSTPHYIIKVDLDKCKYQELYRQCKTKLTFNLNEMMEWNVKGNKCSILLGEKELSFRCIKDAWSTLSKNNLIHCSYKHFTVCFKQNKKIKIDGLQSYVSFLNSPAKNICTTGSEAEISNGTSEASEVGNFVFKKGYNNRIQSYQPTVGNLKKPAVQSVKEWPSTEIECQKLYGELSKSISNKEKRARLYDYMEKMWPMEK